MKILFFISIFYNFFQENIESIICFNSSFRNNYQEKIFIVNCFFQNIFYNSNGGVIFINNIIEKCLIEKCYFKNCKTSTYGGVLFIEYSLLKIVIHKICADQCLTTTNSNGQFFYSKLNNGNIIYYFSAINCSLINTGYTIIETQEGNVSYKYSNTSNQKMYHVLLGFQSTLKNYVEISFSNLNSNFFSAYLVLFISYGILLKNVYLTNLVNNSHTSSFAVNILNRGSNILFDSIILKYNSHINFGIDNEGISFIQNSFIFGSIGSINYLSNNNSITIKSNFEIKHYSTGNCFVQFSLLNDISFQFKIKSFLFLRLLFFNLLNN